MKDKRPLLITYIVDLNLLNALILSLSMIPVVMKLIGIIAPTPDLSDVLTRVPMIIILIIISYGLLQLKRWGYRLMLFYQLFSLIVSVVLIVTKSPGYYSGVFFSILGLSLILSARRYFITEHKVI